MSDKLTVNKSKLVDLLTELYTSTGECYACPLYLDDIEGYCTEDEDCVSSMLKYLIEREN